MKKDKTLKDNNYIKGLIKFKNNGSAMLIPEDKYEFDLLDIEQNDTNIALHGDTVLGRLIEKKTNFFNRKKKVKSLQKNKKNPSFKVLKVIKRSKQSYVGTVKIDKKNNPYIIADDPKIFPDFTIMKNQNITLLPNDGDKVIFEIINWDQRAIPPIVKIIEKIGKTHEPSAEFKAILHKYELKTDFTEQLINEVNKIKNEVTREDIIGRKDLRDEYIFTIDPDDAKDFDDALSIKKINQNTFEIGIHIADVSHYIKPDTFLDKEAQNRGNSTYLVGTVIPMLPYKLSNGLCSLVEGETRLTKSVIITFNIESEIQKVEFANTVIKSNKRLTYKQALAFLKKENLEDIKKTKLPPKHQTGSTGRDLISLGDEELIILKSKIKQLWKIASKLRYKRFKKGSLELDMPEMKIYVDKNGYSDRLEKQTNDESHQLIEEYMLIANEQIAKLTKRNRIPSIYRVHDKPEQERLNELKEVMASSGIICGNLNKSSEMSKLLKSIKNHPQSYNLKLNILKSLQQAKYRATPDGHYGLSKFDYSHFTSPIRRYSDLIVHRILNEYLLKENKKYNQAKLESISHHLSITERNSIDAERESVKIKLLEFFEKEIEKKPLNNFDAVILDIKKHGLFVELTESQAFGMVHISNLGDDHFYLSSNENNLIGKKTKKVFSIGSKIIVNIFSVDRYKRQIDFKISDHQDKRNKLKNNFEKPINAKGYNKLRKERRAARKRNN